MRGLAARIEGLAALLAVLLILVVLAGHILEQSGWLHDKLAAAIERQTGDSVRFERVSIHWRAPGLSLEGLQLLGEPKPDGERRELARIERAELRLGLSRRGPGLEEVRLFAGHVRLGPELYEALGTLAQTNAALGGEDGGEGESSAPDPRRTPWTRWNDLAVELDLPGGASQPLGRVDLWWRPTALKGPELLGLVTPKFGPGRARLDGIALRGEWDGKNALELALYAPSIAVPRGALPEDAWLGDLGFSDVEGRLAVDVRGTVALDGSAPPQVDVALALDQLRFESADPLFGAEEATVAAAIGFAPQPQMSPLDPEAWSGRVALRAFWNQSPISVDLDLGRDAGPGRMARLELWAPRVPVGSPVTLRTTRACTGPRTGEALGDAWAALEPGGVAALALVAEMPAALDLFERELPPEPHIVLHVDTLGETTLRYVGWPDDRGKVQGFPVPLQNIHGTLVFAHDPEAPRRDRFGMVDVRAAPPSGTARFDGLIVSPQPDWTMTRPEVRMDLVLEDLAVDRDLELGLSGLDLGFDPFARFRPGPGLASGRVRFEQLETNGGMRLFVEVGLADTRAEISEGGLDARLENAAGRLELRFARQSFKSGLDTKRPMGAAFALVGTGSLEPDGSPMTVGARGAWREAIVPPEYDGEYGAETLELRGSLEGVDLGDGALWAALDRAGVPSADLLLSGTADLHGVLAAGGEPGGGSFAVEVEGSAMRASGGALPLALGPWRGLASARVDGDLLAWLADRGPSLDFRATAAASGPIAGDALAAARLEADAESIRVLLVGTRLDPNAPALRAALVELVGAPPSDPSEGLLPGGVELEGYFDVAAELTLPKGSSADLAPAVRLYPRSPTLRAPGLELADLRGRLDLEGERVRSNRLDARFGDTLLQLEDLELWRRDPDGRWRGGTRPMSHPAAADSNLLLGLRLSFVDLVIDGERLAALGATPGQPAEAEPAGPEQESTLVAPWRLELDARAADVLLALGSASGPVAWISGEFVPHDVRVDLGLPIGVSTARVVLERLIVENGDARGWGHADQLYATLGGRSIEDGRMVATYTAGRLTVDDLVARFAGGRITSLGVPIGPGQGPAPTLGAPRPQGRALAVDLIEGGRFDLSLGFDDLQVRMLLAGLVSTDQVTGGRVHASLRLAGLPADPLSLEGSGLVRVERARLGSVPVARAVFTALGFDATATFDRASARFDLEQGVARIEALEVQSPLLQLVGAGELGLDGRIRVDLDVEYSVLEALGPLRSLVYWFQNRLLSLSVRGDLSRPAVTVRNLFLDLFRLDVSELPVLPLPPPPPLPARF